jgi:hypothetical protein
MQAQEMGAYQKDQARIGNVAECQLPDAAEGERVHDGDTGREEAEGTMRTTYVVLAVTALVGSAVIADGHLNAAIGRPSRALYRSIQDARDWQNPLIIVQDDGVDVQAKGITGINGRKHVSVEDLAALLISLPVSAWPYGRVVVQTDQGVVPSPAGDYLRKMAQTRPRVAIVLKKLRITSELWPS